MKSKKAKILMETEEIKGLDEEMRNVGRLEEEKENCGGEEKGG